MDHMSGSKPGMSFILQIRVLNAPMGKNGMCNIIHAFRAWECWAFGLRPGIMPDDLTEACMNDLAYPILYWDWNVGVCE